MSTSETLILIHVFLLGVALALGGLVLWRRQRSRRALVARVQELSLLADAGRAILDAPLDLEQLAEAVYRQASQIVDTNIFQLGLFDGDRYRLLVRVVDGVHQPPTEFRLTAESLGIVGWLRESRKSLLVRDFEAERDTLPARPRYLSDLPPKSGVFVPLLVGTTVLGAVTIQSWQRAAFSEDDLRLLTILANHAAAALEKGRLLEQARRRADQLQQLAEVTQQLDALQPLPDVYRQVVQLAAARFGAYDVSYFAAEGEALTLAATTRPEWRGAALILKLGQGVVGEAALAHRPVVRQELPEYSPGAPTALSSARPELAVPVEIDGRLLGVLNALSQLPAAFDEVAISLFKSLAAQMAITILEGQTYEAEQRRVKQLSAIGWVSRAVASMLEVDDLLEEVLDLMDERFGYRRARIFLRQYDKLVYRAGMGHSAARRAMEGVEYSIDGPGLIARAARTRTAVLVNDVRTDPDYRPHPDLEDTRAELVVPLVLGDELVGVFDVQSERLQAFGEEDRQTVQTLADTLAVAVRNARLFETERRRRRLAETMRAVSTALTATLELGDVLDLILSGLASVVSYDTASVLLADEGGQVTLRATRGVPDADALNGRTLNIQLFPPGAVLPPTVSFEAVDESGEYHDLLGLEDPCMCLGAVLAVRGEHRGYLVVNRRSDRAFGRGETELISAFAAQAAVAIENARLYEAQQEEAWISTALLQVAEAMVGRPTLTEALETVARLTPLLVGVERVVIYQWVAAEACFRASEVMGLSSTAEQWVREILASAEELGIAVAVPPPVATAATVSLPAYLAEALGGPTGLVWPLYARGDVLGALVIEGEVDLGRRQSILDGIAHQLAMAMESARLTDELAEQQRLELELDVARDIQASFLPKACPQAPGWDICSYWRAARQVGGDFYDFIPLRASPGETRWGIVVADVAGKGVPAALFMAMSRTILRSAAASRISPAATLTRVNQLIVTEARSDLFVTIFYGVWEPQTGRFVYANAGHNEPLCVDRAGHIRPLAGHGVVLGALDEVEYAEHEMHLQPGDRLLLFTDGLTDAVNTAEEEFGLGRVQARLREAQAQGYSAEATLNGLAAAVVDFAGAMGTFDDVTMVLIHRRA